LQRLSFGDRIAGSETTATALAVIIYYLCTNEACRQRLDEEVTEAFPDVNSINMSSVNALKYLHAVCLEALRIFPPLPLGLPRQAPRSGAIVDGIFVPGDVSHSSQYASVEHHMALTHKRATTRRLYRRIRTRRVAAHETSPNQCDSSPKDGCR
jgi:hypothetical protein